MSTATFHFGFWKRILFIYYKLWSDVTWTDALYQMKTKSTRTSRIKAVEAAAAAKTLDVLLLIYLIERAKVGHDGLTLARPCVRRKDFCKWSDNISPRRRRTSTEFFHLTSVFLLAWAPTDSDLRGLSTYFPRRLFNPSWWIFWAFVF